MDTTTIEYISSTETGPTVPPVFIFVVDTCMIEEVSYLKSALAQTIELLPDNSHVGFITFATYVQVKAHSFLSNAPYNCSFLYVIG